MLNSIWQVVRTIGSFISSVAIYIVDTIKDLLYLIKALSFIGSGTATWFTWLPLPFVVLVGVCISVAILYKVLGREG